MPATVTSVGSVVGLDGNAGQSGYAATKAALVGAKRRTRPCAHRPQLFRAELCLTARGQASPRAWPASWALAACAST